MRQNIWKIRRAIVDTRRIIIVVKIRIIIVMVIFNCPVISVPCPPMHHSLKNATSFEVFVVTLWYSYEPLTIVLQFPFSSLVILLGYLALFSFLTILFKLSCTFQFPYETLTILVLSCELVFPMVIVTLLALAPRAIAFRLIMA